MRAKYLFHLLIVSTLMIASTAMARMDKVVSWSYVADTQSETGSPSREGLVQCTITEQLTEVVSTGQVLFIDYVNQSLYRVNPNQQQCVRYTFSNTVQQEKKGRTGLDAAVSSQLHNSLAVFSVRGSTLWQQIGGIRCNKKTAIAGIHLLKQKTVSPRVVDYYGESITETVGEYWVSDQLTGWDQIQAAASARERAFANNPLLRRIDPLGLFAVLGGLPLKGREKSSIKVKEFTLLDKPTFKSQKPELPQECLESIR